LPPEEFQRPPGLVDAQVCNGRSCSTELFLAENVPNGARIVQPGATPAATAQATPPPAAAPQQAASQTQS